MRITSQHFSLLVVVTGTALNACQEPALRSAELPGYSFDYKIQDREATDLIQVFDDGSKTYLQFADPAETPAISDEHGAPMTYERSALFVVIDGRHAGLTVISKGARSLVVPGTAPKPRAMDAPSVTRPPV